MILLSFKAVYEPDKGNKIWIKKLYSKGNLLYLLSYALRAYYSPIKSENMEIRKMVLCTWLIVSSVAMNAQKSGQESDPKGVLSYSLPATSLVLEVEAVQENFYAGPYARYASKYLGIDVRQEDSRTCTVSSVSLTPYIEADNSRRFLLDIADPHLEAAFLQLTSMGLVSCSEAGSGAGTLWRFPSPAAGDFSDKGVTSNLTSEAATLYRNVKHESAYTRMAVKQEIIVEKSVEKRAAEAAAMIFDIRAKRYQILTGDTDATYSGAAMGDAVRELARLEKDYMTMFTGYSEYQTQKKTFEVIPQKNRENQLYVAFRVSDTSGLLPADNLSGKPVILEIVPQPVAPVPVDEKQLKKARGEVFVTYRIPAVCTVRLMDGMDEIFQSRVPVYQLGTESTFPAGIKTN